MYFTIWKVLMDPGLVRVRETPGPRRGWKYTPGGTTYRVGSGSRVAVSPTHIHLKIRYQNDNIRSSVSILGCWWASSGETHLNRPHFDLWKLRFSVSVREELRAYVGLDYWLSIWCSPGWAPSPTPPCRPGWCCSHVVYPNNLGPRPSKIITKPAFHPAVMVEPEE